MNKKILLTGTCGFIMGNFIRKAIYEKQPYNFISIDRVNSNDNNSIYWNKNHTFHIADITDQHIIDTIFQFERPDIVIHGAEERENPVSSNVLGTQVIVNACMKHKVEKIIYLSTDKIYGQLTSEQEVPWNESSAFQPNDFYAASKASGELVIKTAARASGLIYNIVRSSNAYGPRQSPQRLVSKIIRNVLMVQPIPLYDQGLQVRNWTHVHDLCGAIISVLNSGKDNETYNISANQEFTNLEVAHNICNLMGKGHHLITFVEDPAVKRNFRYSTDCSKIKELGWKPHYKFKDGLSNTIDWFSNNKWFK